VLRKLLERRMTILLVEQYLDFALELAEHCVVLSAARSSCAGVSPTSIPRGSESISPSESDALAQPRRRRRTEPR